MLHHERAVDAVDVAKPDMDEHTNGSLSADEIDRKLEERRSARAGRNFALADQIRKELEAAGILIEDAKDGVRWRRK